MYFKTNDESSKRMNQGSHGIGLNICKKFAVGLGGDLKLNENVRQGC